MDIETNNKNKGRWIFAGMIVVAIIVALLLSFGTYLIVDSFQVNNAKENYYKLSSEDVEELFAISNNPTLMHDKKSYNIFNDNCLGNDSSILLSFGCYCEKDGMICISKDKTILTVDGKDIVISDTPSSYINILDNTVYYREDTTRQLYSYSVSDDESTCLVDSSCGEVVVSKKGISYIDLATKTLKYIPFDDMSTSKIVKDKIKSFSVVGNSYFCLTTDNDFGVVSSDGEFEPIADNVDRFLCDGKIVIQKASNIYFVDDKGITETQFKGIEGSIVAFSNDDLYVFEDQAINIYKLSTNAFDKKVVELNDSEILKGFYLFDNKYETIIYTLESDVYVQTQKTIYK